MCISVQRTQNISATNKSNFGYYEKQFRHFGFGADHLLSEAISANIITSNYQQHLRQQLKQLRQTESVHKYEAQFRNIIGQIINMDKLNKISYFVDRLKSATKIVVNYQASENFENT